MLGLNRDLRLVTPFQVAIGSTMSLLPYPIGVNLQEHGQRHREHHSL